MESSLDVVRKLLQRFQASRILLVEWETHLMIRLGYPLVSGRDLFFLIPDDQLGDACSLAADLGLHPSDTKALRPTYTSELSGLGVRYIIENTLGDSLCQSLRPQRLVLLPLSWTGISRSELVSISVPSLPCTIWTVPLPAACAAFVRIAARETLASRLRRQIIGELANVIAYSLFDMSYEGEYMELLPNDQPLSDEEILEMERAIKKVNNWVFKDDEEWIRRALVEVMSGKISYHALPYKKDP